MSHHKFIVGTQNSGKYTEILRILGDLPIDWIPGSSLDPAPDICENGQTYLENAILKARGFSRISGLPALADDSGLEVDALDGAPGLHSSRYFGSGLSDSEKTGKLLQLLKDVPESERTARFRCAAVIVYEDRVITSSEGIVEGKIIDTPLGTDGFGYDPVFWVPDLSMTFSQIPAEKKNRMSHRGRAMRAIREFLLRSPDMTW